jgi:hypothetical protein
MAEFRVAQHGSRWSWLLANAESTEILARSARTYPDETACRRGLSLTVAGAEYAFVVRGGDGSWHWELGDDDGTPLARSCERFGTARACGIALRRFQLFALMLVPRRERRLRAALAPGVA